MGRVCAQRTTLQTHHEVPNDDQIIPKSEKQRYTSRKGRLLLPPRSMKCRMRIMQHYGIAHHSYGKSMRATNYVANPPRGTKRRPKNSKRHGKVGESRLTGRFLGKPWPNTHHGQPPNAWVVAAEQVCMPPTTLQTHYEAQNDIKTGQISPKDKEKGAAACLLLAFRGSHDPIHITDNHPSVCCSCKTSLQATHYVTNPLRGTKWHQNKPNHAENDQVPWCGTTKSSINNTDDL